MRGSKILGISKYGSMGTQNYEIKQNMYIQETEDEELKKLTDIDENSSYHEKTPFNDSQNNTSNLKLI